jgi:anti-anti-sigma regulatory factor
VPSDAVPSHLPRSDLDNPPCVPTADAEPEDATTGLLEPGPGHSPASLRRAVMGRLEGPPRDLVIDLRTVDTMTNSDVAVLVGARARQRARQRRLTLLFDQHSVTDHALSRAGLRGSFRPASVGESAEQEDEGGAQPIVAPAK